MDEIDARIMFALRPIKEFLAIAVADLDRQIPGTIDRIEAVADHPNKELLTRSDEEMAMHRQLQTMVRLAKQWRSLGEDELP